MTLKYVCAMRSNMKTQQHAKDESPRLEFVMSLWQMYFYKRLQQVRDIEWLNKYVAVIGPLWR